MQVPNEIQEMVDDPAALFFVSHSAGKDSQAMALIVRELVPADRVVYIHADLGEVEWPGNVDHIRETTGVDPVVCRNPNKTFLEMVDRRGMWPSPGQRQCTSDLKRGPIQTAMRRIMKERGALRAVSCMGLRAEESPARAKKQAVSANKTMSKAGRTVVDWLPILDWSTEQVFSAIEAAGQKPHPVYAEGMTRLSCSFCIMASKGDLCTAARLRPALYQRYVEMERRIGHTMRNGETLEQAIAA